MHTPQRKIIIKDVINEVIGDSAIVCESFEQTTCEFQFYAQDFELVFTHDSSKIKLSIHLKNVINQKPYVISVNYRAQVSYIRKVLVHFINLICFDKELSNA